MDITRARQLKVGDRVRFPEDRGDPAGVGKVSQILPNSAEQVSHQGQQYIWIEIESLNKKSVWPSNRLS